jgi:hypothetical protein
MYAGRARGTFRFDASRWCFAALVGIQQISSKWPVIWSRNQPNSTPPMAKGCAGFPSQKKRAALFTVLDPYSGGGGKAVPASGPGSPPSLKPRLQCENANPICMEGPTRRPRPANSTRLSGARALAIAVCGSARAPNQPANAIRPMTTACRRPFRSPPPPFSSLPGPLAVSSSWL